MYDVHIEVERRQHGESWTEIALGLSLPVGTVRAYHRLAAAASPAAAAPRGESDPVPASPAGGAS